MADLTPEITSDALAACQANAADIATTRPHGDGTGNVGGMPSYTRSLLKIRVPVSVTLASKKQPTREILELATGSIIKFEKSCNELLELAVGDQIIADGEVVKVGDKFGLRINEMVLPGEKFESVQPAK